MNIVFIKHLLYILLYDLWFLIYRDCQYSGTVRIRLFSTTYILIYIYVIRLLGYPINYLKTSRVDGICRKHILFIYDYIDCIYIYIYIYI